MLRDSRREAMKERTLVAGSQHNPAPGRERGKAGGATERDTLGRTCPNTGSALIRGGRVRWAKGRGALRRDLSSLEMFV